jgi:SAM-dependent MidA family methyltransferase
VDGGTLAGRLAARIAQAGGWLPFDVFMAEALYAPGLGYYSGGRRIFGHDPRGGSDFVTAPELSPFFGRTLAVQVRQALAATGTHEVFEFGAGSGTLAEQVLDALAVAAADEAPPDAAAAPAFDGAAVRYTIVELSGALRDRQQARLTRFGDRVRWLDAWPESIEGVVLGNEVLDAMPVTLVVRRDGRWHERGVALAPDGRFAWADRDEPLAPERLGRAREVLEAFEGADGSVTELHPQGEAFVASLADRLARGAAVLIDYGFPEHEYYHPQREGGTLMCHQGHRADPDPLASVGEKDITAHVNFTGIALAAQDAGLDVLGYTSQARFLINCGLVDLLAAASHAERAMAQKLFAEHEMGELFKVLVLAKGAAFDPVGCREGDRSHTL